MNRIGFVGVLLMTLALSTVAQAEIIDQSQTTSDMAGSGYLLQSNAPVGQVFTPTFGSMDFFTVYLDNTSASSYVGLILNIYDTTSSHTLLGSATVTVASDGGNPGATAVEFDFGSIPLTPGQQYAAAFDNLPTTNILYGYGTDDKTTYTGGYAFAGGIPTSYQEMFQEGVSVPEPTAACLSAIGLICVWGGNQIRRRRRKLGA